MPKPNKAIARIGSSAYKLSLLKVVPGKEATVSSMLENAVRKKNRNKPVCMLKLFGNYDIAAIYRSKGFVSGAAKAGAIPHILSSNQILAFPWTKPRSSSESLEVASARGHVWGLLFFKLSHALREALGVMAEEQVPAD
jgi:hypothetical protein